MLTIDDVAAVPLFSTLSAIELERLARTSADLHLSPGEFAVHEGGERALFAVLSGKIEVVKTFDGIERTLGWRIPGAIFGEVPIALGTPFPGGYRAAEPSRVMRVDIQEYYAIAAASKEISLKVSALARERIGGLQSLSAEPQKPRVTLVGLRWESTCSTLRRFLARNQISFNWLTPDASDLPAVFAGPLSEDCNAAVVQLASGEVIVRPQVRDLANHDCLVFTPMGPVWTFDGTSGLTTMAVRPRLVTNNNALLVEALSAGGGIAVVSRMAVAERLRSGALIELLPEVLVPDLWVKALVPTTRANLARVQTLLTAIREAFRKVGEGQPAHVAVS